MFTLEPAAVVSASAQAGPAAAANPFFAATALPFALELYAVAWVAVLLGLTVLSFRSREP